MLEGCVVLRAGSGVFYKFVDDDGDYVCFSSDDELKVAINNTNDNTLRIYIRPREPRPTVHPTYSSPFNGGLPSRRTSRYDSDDDLPARRRAEETLNGSMKDVRVSALRHRASVQGESARLE